MLFNSYLFLFLFLPIVVASFFFARSQTIRLVLIVSASFLFYGLAGIEHAIVLGIEILWVYACCRSSELVNNVVRLTVCILPIFSALFYYKYITFFVSDVLMLKTQDYNEVFAIFSDTVLPAGISFFTFQLSSFAFDRFRNTVEKPSSVLSFAAYISFFPQLIAGPIVRYSQVKESLATIGDCKWVPERISKAIIYICIGLALKVLIADTLSATIAKYVATPGTLSTLSSVYVVISYSFEIYFDFYGYSLIAIGLGLIFGFQFPRNFARPYEALNIREFWRRWHITLSYWIRDYLYRPLGGNEKYTRNILIVFAVCGLWHGAGWTFIVWGLYHGILVVCYHWASPLWDRMPNLLQMFLTFMLVSLGWVLFLFDFESAYQFIHSLIGLADTIDTASPTLFMWGGLALAGAICFYLNPEQMAENSIGHQKSVTILKTCGYAFLMVLIILYIDRTQGFIYFRF